LTNPSQLALFPGVSGPQPERERKDDAAAEPHTESASAATDDGQIELFADRVVLFRQLDAAIARGRFDEVSGLRARIDETFGPEATRSLAPLDRLAGLAWEGPPAMPLSVWAEVDRHLAGQPHLRHCVRGGLFTRLRRKYERAAMLLELASLKRPLLDEILRKHGFSF